MASQPDHRKDPCDSELDRVVRWLMEHPALPTVSEALRSAIDETIDGRRTGRYSVDQLEKTEKTYLGTKVEILLRAHFGLPKSKGHLDSVIEGIAVDIKWSIEKYEWMFPKEAVGEVCLVVCADDRRSTFSIGVVRAADTVLSKSQNRDGKRRLSQEGRPAVQWVVGDGPLPANQLLHMDPAVRTAILSKRTGQARVAELFRRCIGMAIHRRTVEIVGTQRDPMRRLRGGGPLQREGVKVLSFTYDREEAYVRYGVTLKHDEFVSVRAGASARKEA